MPRLAVEGPKDETLGEYVRRLIHTDPMRLSPTETVLALKELAWTRANAQLAFRLNSCLGLEVKLKHDRQRHDDTTIPAGSSFVLRARFFDRFLGEGAAGLVLLKPEWITLAAAKSEATG